MDRRRAFKIVWFKMKDPNTSIMKKIMIDKSRTEKGFRLKDYRIRIPIGNIYRSFFFQLPS